MTIRRYSKREWNRFSLEIQEKLCEKYEIQLTDYKDPLTKGQIILSIGMAIYHNLNKKNLDKVICTIQKGTGLISEFGKAFDSGPRKTHSQKDVRSAFWGNESKESKRDTRKETMSFFGEKMPFSSSKKIGF